MKTVLAYYPTRGIVQPIRFLLEYLEVKFEDKKYTIREEWHKDKAEFLKTDALANVPYLIDHGKLIFESSAITLYLANKHNRADLFGTTLDDKVVVQQALGFLIDYKKYGHQAFFIPKETFEAKGKEQYRQETLPYKKKLEFLIQGKKFIAGNKISIADFYFHELTDFGKCYDETYFDDFPNLKQQYQTFREIPQIRNYIKSERYLERPFSPSPYSNWG